MNLPFFAVAGDLTALVPVVFQAGPLALALDATSAIPTVFRPVRHADRDAGRRLGVRPAARPASSAPPASSA